MGDHNGAVGKLSQRHHPLGFLGAVIAGECSLPELVTCLIKLEYPGITVAGVTYTTDKISPPDRLAEAVAVASHGAFGPLLAESFIPLQLPASGEFEHP